MIFGYMTQWLVRSCGKKAIVDLISEIDLFYEAL
jgi:hypothetical protein